MRVVISGGRSKDVGSSSRPGARPGASPPHRSPSMISSGEAGATISKMMASHTATAALGGAARCLRDRAASALAELRQVHEVAARSASARRDGLEPTCGRDHRVPPRRSAGPPNALSTIPVASYPCDRTPCDPGFDREVLQPRCDKARRKHTRRASRGTQRRRTPTASHNACRWLRRHGFGHVTCVGRAGEERAMTCTCRTLLPPWGERHR